MAIHRRREHAHANYTQAEAATDADIQHQLHFQSVYPSMVTTGGVQTAVVCFGSLEVRTCKVLWKPALFQLVATTTAPSHANTIDVDQDAEDEESKEEEEEEEEDVGKRGSLRYSLVYFQRGLLGRPRRKCIDLSDGSARFRCSKDGRLLSTRFEFSVDYFAASNSSDHAVAKTLTCRASNATECLAWTSALRVATEYAADQWRLQSLSALTLGGAKAATSPKASGRRRRVSVLSIEDLVTADTTSKPESRSTARSRQSPMEHQTNRSRRMSGSKRRAPSTAGSSSSSRSKKKPAAVKQLPPFRERRRRESVNAGAAPSISMAQSKKMATAPPPMFPPVFDSNSSARCFLTTANSFADTKNVPMLGSNRSVLSSSLVASTRTRRRLRSRVGLSSFSSRRNSAKRRRRRGSVHKPASMAKMVRIRAIDSPFSASAVELSTHSALAAASRVSTRAKSTAVGSGSADAPAPLCLFHPYRSAAQTKRPTNITRRRVRASTNALDDLLLGSNRSSTSERADNSRDEVHAHLAASATQATTKRAWQRAPAASMREYLASAQQPGTSSSGTDVDLSAESLPVERTTEYIDYLVIVAELRAMESQSRQTSAPTLPIQSEQEQRARSRSSAPLAALTQEDALFLTARSALDLDFSDSDEEDESSEVDEDSRRHAWRDYLSSFETEL